MACNRGHSEEYDSIKIDDTRPLLRLYESKVPPSAGPSTSTAKVGKTHQDDTIETLLEPAHRVLLLDTVLEAHPRLLLLPPRYTRTRTAHDDVEVHAEDTDRGVVPRPKIDVLLDAEPEVARLGEVLALELVLLDLQAALEDLLRLRPADGDVHGNLLVTTDAELADGVPRLGGDGGLTGELLENLGRPRQTITRFTDGDVYDAEKERPGGEPDIQCSEPAAGIQGEETH